MHFSLVFHSCTLLIVITTAKLVQGTAPLYGNYMNHFNQARDSAARSMRASDRYIHAWPYKVGEKAGSCNFGFGEELAIVDCREALNKIPEHYLLLETEDSQGLRFLKLQLRTTESLFYRHNRCVVGVSGIYHDDRVGTYIVSTAVKQAARTVFLECVMKD